MQKKNNLANCIDTQAQQQGSEKIVPHIYKKHGLKHFQGVYESNS